MILHGFEIIKLYKSDILHGSPAIQVLNLRGNFVYELHYDNGKIHREDGPAYMSEYQKIYFLDDEPYEYSDFLIKLAKKYVIDETVAIKKFKHNSIMFVTKNGPIEIRNLEDIKKFLKNPKSKTIDKIKPSIFERGINKAYVNKIYDTSVLEQITKTGQAITKNYNEDNYDIDSSIWSIKK